MLFSFLPSGALEMLRAASFVFLHQSHLRKLSWVGNRHEPPLIAPASIRAAYRARIPIALQLHRMLQTTRHQNCLPRNHEREFLVRQSKRHRRRKRQR